MARAAVHAYPCRQPRVPPERSDPSGRHSSSSLSESTEVGWRPKPPCWRARLETTVSSPCRPSSLGPRRRFSSLSWPGSSSGSGLCEVGGAVVVDLPVASRCRPGAEPGGSILLIGAGDGPSDTGGVVCLFGKADRSVVAVVPFASLSMFCNQRLTHSAEFIR